MTTGWNHRGSIAQVGPHYTFPSQNNHSTSAQRLCFQCTHPRTQPPSETIPTLYQSRGMIHPEKQKQFVASANHTKSCSCSLQVCGHRASHQGTHSLQQEEDSDRNRVHLAHCAAVRTAHCVLQCCEEATTQFPCETLSAVIPDKSHTVRHKRTKFV